MRVRSLILTAVACLFAGACQSQTKPPASAAAVAGKKSAFDKAAFEAYLRHLSLWPPDIKVEIGDPVPSATMPGFKEVHVHISRGPQYGDYTYQVSADGQRFFTAPVYNVAQNPFKPELDKLKVDYNPSFGTPGAPVVLVEFSDFQCPYCREEAKALREKLLATYPKEVRLYFMDFPLEQLHPYAKPAAIAGRCVYRQNALAFWDYHDWAFDHQPELNADNFKSKFLEWAGTKKLDTLQLGRCYDNKSTAADVEKAMAVGRSVDVNSTPTLFINGRKIAGNHAWDELKYIIDYELNYQKTAQNAGEQACCSLELNPTGKR